MDSNYEISLQLMKIHTNLNTYTETMKNKLSQNKSGKSTYLNSDVDKLLVIQDEIKWLLHDGMKHKQRDELKDLQNELVEEKIKCAKREEQLQTILGTLQLCHNDYKANNREDALLVIENSVKEAEIEIYEN